MTSDVKTILTTMGIVVASVGFIPYIVDIIRARTKPHSFSWFIWSILTGTAFAGQVAGEAGVGAWVTAVNCATCFGIFVLSMKYGERHITRSDCITFACAIAAIPLWLFTKVPLYSMILVTAIDILGFYPTFRKSWNKPHEETIIAYALSGIMYAFGVAALEKYAVLTVLYPLSLVISNLGFVSYALWRRRVVGAA